MVIFNVSGKAESGKNTVCGLIEEYYTSKGLKVCNLLFAKRIKQYAMDYFGWDGKEETKPRELLQNIGTEIIRDKLNNPDFHVNSVIQDIEVLSNYFDVFVISDLRFENELNLIRYKFEKEATSIRVNRKNHTSKLTTEQLNHKSETALDNYKHWDYTINNDGTLEELKNKTIKILKENGI